MRGCARLRALTAVTRSSPRAPCQGAGGTLPWLSSLLQRRAAHASAEDRVSTSVALPTVIGEADRALIGVETEPGYHLIEAGAVRRFCEAVGLTDPVYVDVAAARAPGLPQRPVPPTLSSPPP